jgi:hypothetical protein
MSSAAAGAGGFQAAKAVVLAYFAAMEAAAPEAAADVLRAHAGEAYSWRGVHPFRAQQGAQAAADAFWTPLKRAFHRLQRRQDIFIAGVSEIGGGVWVTSMGRRDRPVRRPSGADGAGRRLSAAAVDGRLLQLSRSAHP